MLRVRQGDSTALAGLLVEGLVVGNRDAFCASVAARKKVVEGGFRRRGEGG